MQQMTQELEERADEVGAAIVEAFQNHWVTCKSSTQALSRQTAPTTQEPSALHQIKSMLYVPPSKKWVCCSDTTIWLDDIPDAQIRMSFEFI